MYLINLESINEILEWNKDIDGFINDPYVEYKKPEEIEEYGSTNSVPQEKKKRHRTRAHPQLNKLQTRVDVRFKKIFRSIIWITRKKIEEKLKSADGVVEKALRLIEILQQYREFGQLTSQSEFVKVYFLIANKALKSKFESTVQR